MTIRRRILLAELKPKIPLPQVFATWDPANKTSSMTLSSGNLTATGSGTAYPDGTADGATSSVDMTFGQYYWETTVSYGVGADFQVGIQDPTLTRSHPLGTDWLGNVDGSRSIGVGKAGTAVGHPGPALGAIASGSIIRHWLDMDAKTYSMALGAGAWVVFLSGAAYSDFLYDATGGTPIGIGTVQVAVRCFGNAGNSASVSAKFGGSTFAYTPPDNANPGVYTSPDTATTLYLGSEGFDATIGGSPVHFMGRIAGNQDVEIESEASCWVWGTKTISRRGQITIINNDGALDAWRDYIWRDASVLLRAGWEGDAFVDFVPWAFSRADSIELTRESRIVITLADPLAWTDRAMQPTLYPADQANLQLAGQPLPIVYGLPKFCTPAKLSTIPAVRDYQLHDSSGADALASIAAVYDSGDIFAGPNDPFTAAAIITGSNGGNFTGNNGAVPPVPLYFAAVSGDFGPVDFFYADTGVLHCKSKFAPAVVMEHSSTTLLARTRYRITFTCSSIAASGEGSLIFRALGSPDVSVSITTTGSKSVALYVRANAKLRILMQGDGIDLYISGLRVNAEQVIDWTYWGGTRGFSLTNSPYGKVVADPVGTLFAFEDFVQDVATRVQLPQVVIDGTTYEGYDAATAVAVQARNEYYALDAYLNQPTMGAAFLAEMMDAWCGCPVSNRLGLISFRKIGEPSATPTLTLDESNIIGAVTVSTDRAKQLTIRLSGAKNNTVHTATDVATGVPDVMSALLQSEWGITAEGAPDSAGPVSSAYAAAIAAPAKGLMIRLFSQLQQAANKVATLWRPTRNFYSVTAILDASTADDLEPFRDSVFLIWPKWGLDAGKSLLVVGVRRRFFSRRVDLKLWG